MFRLKTEIIYGRGSIEKLKVEGRKVAIFSSNSMIKYGFTDEIIASINSDYFLIHDIKAEPDEKDIEKYVELLEKERPDIIIAIGGGSVIDTAKASLYHYGNSHLIAIPSTSGSGSEVTMASVLSRNGIKYSIVSKRMAPRLAILDSRLPERMDARLASYTGMDALAHAIESYFSNISSPFSRIFSLKAAKNIFEYLPESVKGGKDAREIMHYSACMAGIAILNARVGLCHVMAHKLGIFGIPHGLAIAILLDHVVEFNMKSGRVRRNAEKMRREIGINEIVDEIRELKNKVGIGRGRDYIKEGEYMEKMDYMVDEVLKDPLLEFNPRKVEREDVKRIYERVYE